MKNKLFVLLLIAFQVLSVVSFSTIPFAAQAQRNLNTNSTTTSTSSGDSVQDGLRDISEAFPEGAKKDKDIQSVAKTIIDWALYLAAIAAVIFIIIGGFMYIASRGDDTQAKNGRKTLVNALIGLAIVVLSYIIVQIVYNFLINSNGN